MKKNILILSMLIFLLQICIGKEMNVLTIGNSFTDSLKEYLPKVAQSDPDVKLVFERANFGGCSLDRHWSYIEKEESDKSLKIYRGGNQTLRYILQSKKWDIVTIQQVSHKSWMPETYFPYAQNIYNYIKKYAPQAEIIIQQTWSYRCDDGRLNNGVWKITQDEMYERLTSAYIEASKKLGTRIIPTGLAVQIARKNQPYSYKPYDKKLAKKLLPPDLPELAGALVGRFAWNKNKDGKMIFVDDTIHLSDRGKYLQACLWYGFIFNKDPRTIKFEPKTISSDDAKFLRESAAKALEIGIK